MRLCIFVKGHVQGVYFRHYTRKKAIELGLTGRVKNLNDSSVKIIAEGEKEKLTAFTEWLKKGPDYAKVKDVLIQEEASKKEFTEFRIEY